MHDARRSIPECIPSESRLPEPERRPVIIFAAVRQVFETTESVTALCFILFSAAVSPGICSLYLFCLYLLWVLLFLFVPEFCACSEVFCHIADILYYFFRTPGNLSVKPALHNGYQGTGSYRRHKIDAFFLNLYFCRKVSDDRGDYEVEVFSEKIDDSISSKRIICCKTEFLIFGKEGKHHVQPVLP